jgi:cohesin complex subunit SCC1
MFFSDSLLSKRNGPLAKVWLASHMGDRKLSKAQLLGTSIPKSVGAIMGQELVPMALRLSGQLLLGVARIYSRKAKYLMDDCNDALLKIKMTFRPGATAAVDMTAEQAHVAKGAITRQEQGNEFDLLYQDADVDYWNQEAFHRTATPGRGVAIAEDADITRPDDDLDFELPRVEFGDDLFGTGDFDLGLGDDEPAALAGTKHPRDEDDLSVELGRDAPGSSARKSARMSLGRPGSDPDADLTFDQTFDDFGGGGGAGYEMDVDYGMPKDPFSDKDGFGGGADFDLSGVLDSGGLDAPPPRDGTIEPKADGARSAFARDSGFRAVAHEAFAAPRGTTPDPNATGETEIDVTPRTAKLVTDTAALNSAKKRKAAQRTKGGKQIVDASTELQESQGGGRGPLGSQSQGGRATTRATDPSLLVPARYLPRSRTHLRLLEIEADPASVYLPKAIAGGKLFAGPVGLPEPLAELFHFKAPSHGPSAAKRARMSSIAMDDDPSIELGRHAGPNARLSDRFSLGLGDQPSFDDSWAPNAFAEYGGGGEGDKGGAGYEMPIDYGSVRGKSSTPAPAGSRAVTPFDLWSTPSQKRTPGEGALGVFDVAPSTEASQRTASQVEEKQAASSGWSKNTVRALRVLSDELGPAPTEAAPTTDKVVSFDAVSEKVRHSHRTRRARRADDRTGLSSRRRGLLLRAPRPRLPRLPRPRPDRGLQGHRCRRQAQALGRRRPRGHGAELRRRREHAARDAHRRSLRCRKSVCRKEGV